MFKQFTAFVHKYVVQRKADQMHQVIDSYEAAVTVTTPIIITAYADMAHTIVDKTVERPDLLINLATALSNIIDHYGPALEPALNQIDKITTLDVVKVKLDTLVDHLQKLQHA